MKALIIEVYKHNGEDFSNGGITSRFNELLLVCDDGYIDIDEDNPPENLVVFEDRFMFGERCGYIRPYAEHPEDRTPYMAGGAYAASSDSRFSEMVGIYGAVPVHDRTETWEEYELLSR